MSSTITFPAVADAVIKPYCYVMDSPNIDPTGHTRYYERVVPWDGRDIRQIKGMYVRIMGEFIKRSVPMRDAVKGDIIELVPHE